MDLVLGERLQHTSSKTVGLPPVRAGAGEWSILHAQRHTPRQAVGLPPLQR